MYIVLQNTVSILGLILDILGALYVSKGLLNKNAGELRKENCFVYGVNDNYVINGMKDKIQCKYGFIIIFFGFILQILSQLHSDAIFLCIFSAFNACKILVVMAGIIIILHVIGKAYVQWKYINFVKEYLCNKMAGIQNIKKINVGDLRRYIRYIKPNYDRDNIKSRDLVQHDLFTVIDLKVNI